MSHIKTILIWNIFNPYKMEASQSLKKVNILLWVEGTFGTILLAIFASIYVLVMAAFQDG